MLRWGDSIYSPVYDGMRFSVEVYNGHDRMIAIPTYIEGANLWVGGPSALGCHGLSTVWIASGAVTPPPASATWEPHAPPAGWLTTSRSEPVGVALIPPDPPPRLATS